MNIFILDKSPVIAAQMHCDKHIDKLPKECVKMLSIIVGEHYKASHNNHPCIEWASASVSNFFWLYEYSLELCRECSKRYNKEHVCRSIILNLEAPHITYEPPTPFVQCMPEIYRQEDAVEAYRAYYHSKTFAKWKHSETPKWWKGNAHL